MNRWCIISGPRSGSVYVEGMIYRSFSTSESATILGEFLSPNLGVSHMYYELDENRNIKANTVESSMTITDLEKFYQDRVSLIKSANIHQPLTMRIFCLRHNFAVDRYLEFFKILQDLNFQFISLKRNLFNRAISFYFMIKYGRIHRFLLNNGEMVITKMKGKDLPTIPVEINLEEFMDFYRQVVDDDRNREMVTQELNCPIIRYENVFEDLNRAGVPISTEPFSVLTYDEKYQNMVSNYQEILNTVNMAYDRS